MVDMKNNTPFETKKWYLIDAKGKTLGRISTLIAKILMGKHKSTYVPYLNCGDYVVVINVEKIEVTGKKRTKKIYRRHSGRPGSLKIETFDKLIERIPERILEKSVKGMLPKGSLGRDVYKNLKVYQGAEHPYTAQKPLLLV